MNNAPFGTFRVQIGQLAFEDWYSLGENQTKLEFLRIFKDSLSSQWLLTMTDSNDSKALFDEL